MGIGALRHNSGPRPPACPSLRVVRQSSCQVRRAGPRNARPPSRDAPMTQPWSRSSRALIASVAASAIGLLLLHACRDRDEHPTAPTTPRSTPVPPAALTVPPDLSPAG